jgi:hypothetical protein
MARPPPLRFVPGLFGALPLLILDDELVLRGQQGLPYEILERERTADLIVLAARRPDQPLAHHYRDRGTSHVGAKGVGFLPNAVRDVAYLLREEMIKVRQHRLALGLALLLLLPSTTGAPNR